MSGDRVDARQVVAALHPPPATAGTNIRSSFGDPNAQPPTPKQTPTSAIFPSPVLQTPKNTAGSFENQSGWTPRFAEEYSVFNSTPGNLRGGQATFADFAASTPYQQQASSHKRPLSAENIAAEIAAHANHLSPNPNVPLPPVDPAQRLPSAREPVAVAQFSPNLSPQHGPQEHSAKKPRRETLQEVQGQTVTPPSSARKGERKLAPKLQTDTMQNDQGYGQEYVAGTPQQSHMPNFVTTPTDMFGYPITAPATAPVFTDSRPFWDTDANMGVMDFEFSAGQSNVFQTPTHRGMDSFDWSKSHEMMPQAAGVMQQSQENAPPPTKGPMLAPKPQMSNLDTSNGDMAMFGPSYTTPVEDPFGMMNQAGGVDPGLLFTRPPSSNMEPATFDPMSQQPMMQPLVQPEPLQSQARESARAPIRRTLSSKETGNGKKLERLSASSPIKPSGRPGLSRSASESRGRKSIGRPSLPTLAPAIAPVPQQSHTRSSSQGARSSGRISPLKNHHHRLSSLSSIPETSGPRTRTSVNFVIDARGRARAETTTIVVGDEDTTPTAVRRSYQPRPRSKNWSASSEDDVSSEDDDPIIIPSRNSSFALPEPRKPSSSLLHSQRSISEQGASSLGIYYGEASQHNDGESEAETLLNEPQGSRGDAASELRKVKETRQKRISLNTSQRFSQGGPPYSAGGAISPTTLTETSLPTPSSGSRGNTIRCLCNTTSSQVGGDAFMVQCESCENWLHGKCVKISRRTMPRVYICAFCANTPNAQTARRDSMRNVGGADRLAATSPLAHKSFKSFR